MWEQAVQPLLPGRNMNRYRSPGKPIRARRERKLFVHLERNRQMAGIHARRDQMICLQAAVCGPNSSYMFLDAVCDGIGDDQAMVRRDSRNRLQSRILNMDGRIAAQRLLALRAIYIVDSDLSYCALIGV